jgi:hypothetical protein
MLNKRGQGLSTETIILIILGIAVLVILILGFTIGWQKVAPWLSSSNVDTVVNQCQASCNTGDTYSYCSSQKTLKADDLPLVDGKTVKQVSGNCSYFANTADYAKYNIVKCPSITCT